MKTVHVTQAQSEKKLILGIMGGIGSGKTTLAKIFGDFGMCVINADRIGHDVLERDEVKTKLLGVFGNCILSDEGIVDRKRLGKLVFDDVNEMKKLSDIVHPPLLDEFRRQLESARNHVVIDAALLEEFSMTDLCDHLIFIDTPKSLRVERCRERGWDADELERRENFQADLSIKRAKAHTVITNDGTPEFLREQAHKVWERIAA